MYSKSEKRLRFLSILLACCGIAFFWAFTATCARVQDQWLIIEFFFSLLLPLLLYVIGKKLLARKWKSADAASPSAPMKEETGKEAWLSRGLLTAENCDPTSAPAAKAPLLPKLLVSILLAVSAISTFIFPFASEFTDLRSFFSYYVSKSSIAYFCYAVFYASFSVLLILSLFKKGNTGRRCAIAGFSLLLLWQFLLATDIVARHAFGTDSYTLYNIFHGQARYFAVYLALLFPLIAAALYLTDTIRRHRHLNAVRILSFSTFFYELLYVFLGAKASHVTSFSFFFNLAVLCLTVAMVLYFFFIATPERTEAEVEEELLLLKGKKERGRLSEDSYAKKKRAVLSTLPDPSEKRPLPRSVNWCAICAVALFILQLLFLIFDYSHSDYYSFDHISQPYQIFRTFFHTFVFLATTVFGIGSIEFSFDCKNRRGLFVGIVMTTLGLLDLVLITAFTLLMLFF